MPAGINGDAPDVKAARIELPGELYEQLRQAASENQRSIAGEVRYAVGLYLRQLERRRSQAPA